MGAPQVRAEYSQLDQLARLWAQEQQAQDQALKQITQALDALKGGGWTGQGATRFFGEMDSSILPSQRNLIKALEQASRVTTQIRARMQQCEADAAAVLKDKTELTVQLAEAQGSGGSGGDDAQAIEPKAKDEADKPWYQRAWEATRDVAVDIVKGAILGDYAEDTGIAGTIAQVLVGLVPYAGQAADVRDISKATIDYNNGVPGAGLRLIIATVAIIPGLDFLKGAKFLKKLGPLAEAFDGKVGRDLLEFLKDNPREVTTVGRALWELGDNPNAVEALARNTDAILPVLRNGPDMVGLVGKHGDDAAKVLTQYGEHGPDILRAYDNISDIPGAPNLLRDVVAGSSTTQGALGEIRYVNSVRDDVARVGDVIGGKKAADLVMRDGTVVDVKSYNWDTSFYRQPFGQQVELNKLLRQVQLRQQQYPGQPIRYVFQDTAIGGGVPQSIVDGLRNAGVDVVQIP